MSIRAINISDPIGAVSCKSVNNAICGECCSTGDLGAILDYRNADGVDPGEVLRFRASPSVTAASDMGQREYCKPRTGRKACAAGAVLWGLNMAAFLLASFEALQAGLSAVMKLALAGLTKDLIIVESC